MERLKVEYPFYPDLRIKALGEREGISALNLGQPFQAYVERNQIYLHGFDSGHWNPDGHRLAVDLIAEKICTDIPL